MMARETEISLRNEVIYCVFIRNHTLEGTFVSLIPDLARIRGLGTDIIWLLPIHPIGEVQRKGRAGSPYAIKDYWNVNPEYGTMAEFDLLVEAIHGHGMRVIIDVVFNHTSPDSVLVQEHPEWFYRRPNGEMGNKVGEWYDIVDLDYLHLKLWDYQIEMLKFWAGKVDGFRCDVAGLVPLEFWQRARQEVAAVNPGTVWLAETLHPTFIRTQRERGNIALSDGELFQVFDIVYDYDVHGFFEGYLWQEISLKHYLEILSLQDGLYPANYVKLRFLENHDHPRFRSRVPEPIRVRNWMAFLYFQKGATLLYAGQERGLSKRPDLFEKDVINWSNEESMRDLAPLMRRLYMVMKKGKCLVEGRYRMAAAEGTNLAIGIYDCPNQLVIGIFSLTGGTHLLKVDLPDGIYRNYLDDQEYTVTRGLLLTRGEPIILSYYHETLLMEY